MFKAKDNWLRILGIVISASLAILFARLAWIRATGFPELWEGESAAVGMLFAWSQFLALSPTWLGFAVLGLSFWLRSTARLWLSGLILLELLAPVPNAFLKGRFLDLTDGILLVGAIVLFVLALLLNANRQVVRE